MKSLFASLRRAACATLAACAASAGLALIATPCRAAADADRVLLVVNAESPTSNTVGARYALLRGVRNVVRVRCADAAVARRNETISGADYRERIEAPVRAYLDAHPEIDFIALTKGVPIRVDGGATGERFDFENQLLGPARVSVDGALAALGYETIEGAERVAFDDPDGFAIGTAWLNRYWNADEPFSHAKFGGYLVTRLDGFTKADAEKLTARAIVAEAGMQPGPILLDMQPDYGIDDPASQPAPITADGPITEESPFATWNADLAHAAENLARRGVPVWLDAEEAFVGRRRDLRGYFSWGSNDDHFSLEAYRSLGFVPGAIGDTAVSTSAKSMLPPGSDGQSAIGDLIAQGLTGAKGYIEEPLLQAISSPTIVLDRYTRGYTLAESFYAGSHFVGWTDLVIGDPLARPYPPAFAESAPAPVAVAASATIGDDGVEAESQPPRVSGTPLSATPSMPVADDPPR